MEAKIIDGEAVAAKMTDKLRAEIEALHKAQKIICLAAVQVGDNPGSRVYIKNQKKTCEEMGIDYKLHELADTTTQQELIDYLEKLNNDPTVTGIILQMPLPPSINAREVQWKISPAKDVEGMHPSNLGRLFYGQAVVAPCTAMGAVTLLKSLDIQIKGMEVVMVGHSEIVGKPATMLLLESVLESPTVTVCHIATRDLKFHTQRADVVIVAAGKPNLINADMVKEGVILIDIGINRVPMLDENGNPILNDKGKPRMKTVGDADFENIKKKASYITPVPGGVGPMTVAMLIKNTVAQAKANQGM
ncbi:MAG: bifunctional 5,10-methylenetetrahydrofolate dehydrogenase/5,10-methenyltetrahydrofolate cyclohydrolase [bacterium]